MKIIEPGYTILDRINDDEAVRKIERIAKICRGAKSCENIEDSRRFVRGLIEKGHLSCLEHYSFSVLFITDRSVTHELVRHRMASFMQSSTRHMGNFEELEFVWPVEFPKEEVNVSFDFMKNLVKIEDAYFNLMGNDNIPKEVARFILPNCLAAKLVITANIREWRHIIDLRVLGATGRPSKQITELLTPFYKELHHSLPTFF